MSTLPEPSHEDAAEVPALADDEVAIVPVDEESGLVAALNASFDHNESSRIPPKMVNALTTAVGVAGGGAAAKPLLDGSLVRLAPQTVKSIKNGLVFVKDADGFSLGTLHSMSEHGFKEAVRFLPAAGNPIAAGLMIQTMASQAQMAQLRQALEEIDKKLERLIVGKQNEVISDMMRIGRGLDRMRKKVSAGQELTAIDENQVRNLESLAEGRLIEADQWMGSLRGLLASEEPSLKDQAKVLDKSVKQHGVAFWIRVWLASHMALTEARSLLLERAVAAEPAWAGEFESTVVAEMQKTGRAIAELMGEIDAYLRIDFSQGVEGVQFARKRDVKRFRHDLWEIDKLLKKSLRATSEIFDAIPDAEPLSIPKGITRREIEQQGFRDAVYDGAKASRRAAKQVGRVTKEQSTAATERLRKSLRDLRGDE